MSFQRSKRLTRYGQNRGYTLFRLGLVLTLFGMVLTSCQKPEDTTTDIVSGTVHPTDEILLQETDYVIYAREDQAVEEEGPLGQMAHRVKEASAIATVGVLLSRAWRTNKG